MVVDKLPNFECYPSPADGSPGPMHSGTIHFESSMEEIEKAYLDTLQGRPADRPGIYIYIHVLFSVIYLESSICNHYICHFSYIYMLIFINTVIEMTIPSALDHTLTPTGSGKHIVQLFIQYAPYNLAPDVGSWADPAFKEAFVSRCLAIVEEYCPGFRSSILHVDALSPLDLEQIFGLPKGNIHHGSLSLHQLAYMRPAPGSNHM